MYKCTSCGHMQDMGGACEQCGSVTAAQDASNEAEGMPEGSQEESAGSSENM